MNQNMFSLLNLFLTMIIVCTVLFAIIYIITHKYSDKHKKMYYLLFGLDIKTLLLFSIALFDFILALFYLFNIGSYQVVIYATIVLNVIASIIVFNLHLIFVNIIFLAISIYLYYIYMILNDYMNYIYYDKMILLLKVLFTILILLYSFYVVMRKSEILFTNKKARRFDS